LQRRNGHGNDIGGSPARRDPYCTRHELQGRGEQVADDGDRSAFAIHYGRARGSMIEHETVVSVVHFEQRRAGEPAAVAIAYEATTCRARAVARIGEGHNRLLRDERFHPELDTAYTGKGRPQFEHSNLLRV